MSYYFPEILPSYAMHRDTCMHFIALHAYLMIALFVYKCSNIKWNLFLSTFYISISIEQQRHDNDFSKLYYKFPFIMSCLISCPAFYSISLRYKLIYIINIDVVNFAKQSLSLMTSLFLSYTFSTQQTSIAWKCCLPKC